MSTNLQLIADTFQKLNIGFQVDTAQSRLFLLAKGKNLKPEQYCIVNLRAKGELVEIVLPQLFPIQGQVFKGVFLQTLLTIQYETPLIKFWYVPQEESVYASIELPLVDTPLTEANLIVSLNKLITSVDEVIPRLQQVLLTGNDSGKQSELEKAIAKMPPETISEIERLIAQRKQQS